MKSFDEWFKKTMPNTHKGVGKEKIETFVYQTAEDAWNTKQQEVDELQQKIAKALYLINMCEGHCSVDSIRKILEGENHEY